MTATNLDSQWLDAGLDSPCPSTQPDELPAAGTPRQPVEPAAGTPSVLDMWDAMVPPNARLEAEPGQAAQEADRQEEGGQEGREAEPGQAMQLGTRAAALEFDGAASVPRRAALGVGAGCRL